MSSLTITNFYNSFNASRNLASKRDINCKRARTQIQIVTSPGSPVFSEKRPHPVDHVFPTNLYALKKVQRENITCVNHKLILLQVEKLQK